MYLALLATIAVTTTGCDYYYYYTHYTKQINHHFDGWNIIKQESVYWRKEKSVRGGLTSTITRLIRFGWGGEIRPGQSTRGTFTTVRLVYVVEF